jgi:hypothetical protein
MEEKEKDLVNTGRKANKNRPHPHDRWMALRTRLGEADVR